MWAAGLILALLAAVALLIGQHNPYLGDYGDDAELLILGQGLATGQGYAWVNTPDVPAHNRYPPGYPALVTLAMVVSGTGASAAQAIVPAKLLTMVTLAGAAALLWPLARRRLGTPWAAGAVAIFVLNPFVLRFAGEVMSDVPYVMVLLAALVWADRLSLGGARATRRRARSGLGGGWRLGALLALGAYVRSVGLAAGAGALAWAWWYCWSERERERGTGLGRWAPWAPALAATGAFLLLLLPWWVRDATLAGGWRYLEELLAAQYSAPAAGTVTSSDLIGRAVGNVGFLVGKPGVFGAAGMVAGVAGAAVVLTGYWTCLRRVGGGSELRGRRDLGGRRSGWRWPWWWPSCSGPSGPGATCCP